jgi:glycopeptide antibiotics resistance protein
MEAYLQGIVIWIYRQRPKHLIEYAVYAAMIFGILCRRLKGARWVRICLRAMLVCWFAAILWITVFCRQSGGSYDAYWIPLHSYPYFFNEEYPEAFRSVFMNVLLFYPAGLLWAALSTGEQSYRNRMLRMMLLFGLFSLSVELTQYFFQLGTAETDDVLHNTLGTVCGYAAFYHLNLSNNPVDKGQ